VEKLCQERESCDSGDPPVFFFLKHHVVMMQIHECDLHHVNYEVRKHSQGVILLLKKRIYHCVVVHGLVLVLGEVVVQSGHAASKPRNVKNFNFQSSGSPIAISSQPLQERVQSLAPLFPREACPDLVWTEQGRTIRERELFIVSNPNSIVDRDAHRGLDATVLYELLCVRSANFEHFYTVIKVIDQVTFVCFH